MASDQMFLISRCFVAIILVGCFVMGSSQASIEFNVGGKYGWALRPSKTHNQWAAKNRFQIDDSLVFKYKNGTDSVLVVDQEDYEACNKEKPIRSPENEGEFARIKLDHAGLYFFISGYDHYCEEGQKLVVLVMQPRGRGRVGKTQPPSPSPSPSMSPTLAPSSSPFPIFPAPAPAPVLATPTQSPEAGSDEEAAKSGEIGFNGGSGLVNLLFCLMLLLVCF